MAGARTRSIWAGIVAAPVALFLFVGVAQAGRAQIRLGNTLAGQVLTDRAGYVLMMFPREENSLKLCIRIPSCMSDWPPVTTTGHPVAGPGVDVNLLGTEPYRGKLLAVTYAGWPLHTYRFAYSAQNSIMNIGIRQFGGRWDALGPAGQFIT
jgi:predicted lipoprotein with Yx(FWY)xxD motif